MVSFPYVSWLKHSLLVHCRAGIGRSTAAAYVAACVAHPEIDERKIAEALRQASPLARPNETLVLLADREMGRDGRMHKAIASTGHGLSPVDVDENDPFELVVNDGNRLPNKPQRPTSGRSLGRPHGS